MCDYFFQFTTLKIFNVVNAGAELGLATPLTTATSVSYSFDENYVYLNAERLYEPIKMEDFLDAHCTLT